MVSRPPVSTFAAIAAAPSFAGLTLPQQPGFAAYFRSCCSPVQVGGDAIRRRGVAQLRFDMIFHAPMLPYRQQADRAQRNFVQQAVTFSPSRCAGDLQATSASTTSADLKSAQGVILQPQRNDPF